jgi:hypothetical protein
MSAVIPIEVRAILLRQTPLMHVQHIQLCLRVQNRLECSGMQQVKNELTCLYQNRVYFLRRKLLSVRKFYQIVLSKEFRLPFYHDR